MIGALKCSCVVKSDIMGVESGGIGITEITSTHRNASVITIVSVACVFVTSSEDTSRHHGGICFFLQTCYNSNRGEYVASDTERKKGREMKIKVGLLFSVLALALLPTSASAQVLHRHCEVVRHNGVIVSQNCWSEILGGGGPQMGHGQRPPMQYDGRSQGRRPPAQHGGVYGGIGPNGRRPSLPPGCHWQWNGRQNYVDCSARERPSLHIPGTRHR